MKIEIDCSKFVMFTLAVLSTSCSALAISPTTVQNKKAKIESLIKNSGLERGDLGIYIADGEDTSVVLAAVNEKEKFVPASITKIVTAGAALKYFPPGSKFKTQIFITGAVSDGKLMGDVYLKGGGDPSFVSETMWFLVNSFVRNEINEVDGDIIVDDTLFDRIRYDESRESSRADNAYDAPVGAMSFNWNSVNVIVRPANKVGQPAKVFLDPENEFTALRGRVVTGTSSSLLSVAADRIDGQGGRGDVIQVSGSIPLGHVEKVIYRNISQPDVWSGHNLKSFFQQRGIKVKGAVRSGKTPDTAQLKAEAEGKAIDQIVQDMNKWSNNYVAEMLTKAMGAKLSGQGSIDSGMRAIKEYLIDLGVKNSEFELINPSGLTIKNKISAVSLWKVLDALKNQFIYQPEFSNSLPIAGVDGTLKKRFLGSGAERKVRAKTGLLSQSGVVALAGYAGRSNGEVWPFVFMYKGSADCGNGCDKVRHFFDRLATIVAE